MKTADNAGRSRSRERGWRGLGLMCVWLLCQPLGAMRLDNLDTPYFPKVTFPEGAERPVVALHESTSYLLPGTHATHRMEKGRPVEVFLEVRVFPAFSVEGWVWSGVHEDGTPVEETAFDDPHQPVTRVRLTRSGKYLFTVKARGLKVAESFVGTIEGREYLPAETEETVPVAVVDEEESGSRVELFGKVPDRMGEHPRLFFGQKELEAAALRLSSGGDGRRAREQLLLYAFSFYHGIGTPPFAEAMKRFQHVTQANAGRLGHGVHPFRFLADRPLRLPEYAEVLHITGKDKPLSDLLPEPFSFSLWFNPQHPPEIGPGNMRMLDWEGLFDLTIDAQRNVLVNHGAGQTKVLLRDFQSGDSSGRSWHFLAGSIDLKAGTLSLWAKDPWRKVAETALHAGATIGDAIYLGGDSTLTHGFSGYLDAFRVYGAPLPDPADDRITSRAPDAAYADTRCVLAFEFEEVPQERYGQIPRSNEPNLVPRDARRNSVAAVRAVLPASVAPKGRVTLQPVYAFHDGGRAFSFRSDVPAPFWDSIHYQNNFAEGLAGILLQQSEDLISAEEKEAMLRAYVRAYCNWVRYVLPRIKSHHVWAGVDDWNERVYMKLGGDNAALIYDLLQSHMDEAQRDLCRELFLKATHPDILLYQEFGWRDRPAFSITGENQPDGLHRIYGHRVYLFDQLLASLVVEGERLPAGKVLYPETWEGRELAFHSGLLKRGEDAVNRYVQYNFWPDGTPAIKSLAHAHLLVALARRGNDAILHPHLQAYFAEHLLHACQPFGNYEFVESVHGDSLHSPGPEDRQAAGIFAQLYPENLAIRRVASRRMDGLPYISSPANLFLTVFPAPDFSVRPEPEGSLNRQGFARGDSFLRSSWGDDAVMLYQRMGSARSLAGHGDPNRNAIVFSAHGVNWIGSYGSDLYWREQKHTDPLSMVNSSRIHSNVTVDGYGPGNMPGRCVAFREWDDGALVAGDATFAYSRIGVVRDTVDRAGEKFPFKNRGLFTDYQDHLGADYLERLGGKNGHMVERWMKKFRQEIYDFHPVLYAYRTSLLIRGERPYALVIDDIRKPDDAEHSFYFQMNMRDPEVNKNVPSPQWLEAESREDCQVFRAETGAGPAWLAIASTSTRGPTQFGAYALDDTFKRRPWTTRYFRKDAVGDPGFVTLLYPSREPLERGDLPGLTLERMGEDERLTVSLPGGRKDVYRLFRTAEGRRRIEPENK